MYQRTDLGGIGRVWLKRLEFLGNLKNWKKAMADNETDAQPRLYETKPRLPVNQVSAAA